VGGDRVKRQTNGDTDGNPLLLYVVKFWCIEKSNSSLASPGEDISKKLKGVPILDLNGRTCEWR